MFALLFSWDLVISGNIKLNRFYTLPVAEWKNLFLKIVYTKIEKRPLIHIIRFSATFKCFTREIAILDLIDHKWQKVVFCNLNYRAILKKQRLFEIWFYIFLIFKKIKLYNERVCKFHILHVKINNWNVLCVTCIL